MLKRRPIIVSKVILSLLVTLFLVNSSYSQQITIEGKQTASQKETSTFTVKAPGVDDLKISVFPKNKAWKLSRNYDDPTIIEINFTPTTDGIYYFNVAGNLDKKTLVGELVVIVGVVPDKPDPIIPTPTPKPKPDEVTVNPYKDDIEAAYLVNPDSESKVKLIKIYQDIAKGNYASWETCQLDLKAKVTAANLTDKLTNVKKAVVTLLTKDTKDVPYSSQLKTKLFTQAADALSSKELP